MKRNRITCQRAVLWACLSLLSPALGVRLVPAAQTMNIEIDYMVEGGAGGHSHRPQAAEIAAVVQMFACHGITLNIVVDDALPHVNVMPRDPNNANNFFGYSGNNGFKEFKDTYFDHDGQAGWHYCIFAHQYQDKNYNTTGSSGLGEGGGDDFIVTLGGFDGEIGTPWDRAATLAHEFGHNLGLGHGTVDDYQPNKPSIMSYFYQLRGVRTAMLDYGLTAEKLSLFKEMDYSDGRMCSLLEAALNEGTGTGMVPVDWNCNGATSGVVSVSLDDARNWCNSTNLERNLLTDYNEWANLQDNTFNLNADLDNVPVVSCITADEARAFMERAVVKAQPPVTSEPCVSARMIYLKADAVFPGTGPCTTPFPNVGFAAAVATSGSHFFFWPGTYRNDPGPLVLNKRMTLFCEIGTAVIRPTP